MLPFQSNHAIDELLVSYLLEEATEEQQQSALIWISASPENERYFQEFQQIWEKSRELAATSSVDVNAAWERMREKLEKGKKGGMEEGKNEGKEKWRKGGKEGSYPCNCGDWCSKLDDLPAMDKRRMDGTGKPGGNAPATITRQFENHLE